MPFQLNRVPIGLSDLLGAKTWPVNQNWISDQLQLVFDARNEYLEAQVRTLSQTISPAAVGTPLFTAFTIPEGENWYVHEFSLWSGNMAAGNVLTFCPFYQQPGAAGVGGIYFGPQPGLTTTVGSYISSAWSVKRWLPQATQFGAGIQWITGAAISVNGVLRYTPIRT